MQTVDSRAPQAGPSEQPVAESRLGFPAEVKLAFTIAFDHRRAYVLAVAGAVAMFALLVWTGGFIQFYPQTGWEFDASLSERLSVGVVAVLFGALLPLELTALSKARGAAGAAGAGGVLGPVFGILSMSCCAPLLAPALLSFVGFSGTTLLRVNVALYELATPLTLASVGLLLLSVGLVSHTIAAACMLPDAGAKKESR